MASFRCCSEEIKEHCVELPRRTQALQGDSLSQRSLQAFEDAPFCHQERPTHLCPLQKVQLNIGFSRLLVWDVDWAIGWEVPAMALTLNEILRPGLRRD